MPTGKIPFSKKQGQRFKVGEYAYSTASANGGVVKLLSPHKGTWLVSHPKVLCSVRIKRSDLMSVNQKQAKMEYDRLVEESHRKPEPLDLSDPNLRESTHGPWDKQSRLSQSLKFILREGGSWESLTTSQREALEMICVKMSRIAVGNSDEPDHWDDIGGYAMLGKQGNHTK